MQSVGPAASAVCLPWAPAAPGRGRGRGLSDCHSGGAVLYSLAWLALADSLTTHKPATQWQPGCWRRDGATIPALAAFQTLLNLSTTKFGWGLSEAIHAPNERLKLSQWHLGRLAWGHLLVALADNPQLRQQAQARQQQSNKDNAEHHCPAAVTS
ncbi:hypothetical protein V8C86DRAFT_2438261 [Haematococcus lacustris]